MDFKLDSNCRAEIQDIIKSLKVNGSFDQFRKECFAEILTQPSFQKLKKNVEDYVHKYLNEIKPNSNIKKTVLRDNLRRNLTESLFMNDGINKIIEEIVEPKLEKTFIEKIDELVHKESKASNDQSSAIKATATTTTITYQQQAQAVTLPSSSINQVTNSQSTQQQDIKIKKLISVEDFIPIPENKSSPAQQSTLKQIDKKSATPTTPKQSTVVSNLASKQIFKEHTKSKPVETTPKQSQSVTKKDLPRSKSSDANADKTISLKHSTSNLDDDDTDLETDPTNEYNFNWKLKNINLDLDDLSVSSLNTTDLSDFE